MDPVEMRSGRGWLVWAFLLLAMTVAAGVLGVAALTGAAAVLAQILSLVLLIGFVIVVLRSRRPTRGTA